MKLLKNTFNMKPYNHPNLRHHCPSTWYQFKELLTCHCSFVSIRYRCDQSGASLPSHARLQPGNHGHGAAGSIGQSWQQTGSGTTGRRLFLVGRRKQTEQTGEKPSLGIKGKRKSMSTKIFDKQMSHRNKSNNRGFDTNMHIEVLGTWQTECATNAS